MLLVVLDKLGKGTSIDDVFFRVHGNQVARGEARSDIPHLDDRRDAMAPGQTAGVAGWGASIGENGRYLFDDTAQFHNLPEIRIDPDPPGRELCGVRVGSPVVYRSGRRSTADHLACAPV